MKNQNSEIKNEKNRSSRYQTLGMSVGMCFGLAIGMSIGYLLFDNGLTGMSTGLPIGMLLGMAVGMAKDKKINEQIDTKGYTILEINQKDDIQDEYAVKIGDKDGQESIVVVSKNNMKTEKFEVGDVVYMNEDGGLEQVVDRDKHK